MDRNTYLNNLANMLNTLGELRNVYNSRKSSGESRLSEAPEKKELLTEMLRVLTEHSPDTHKRIMGDTLEKSCRYFDTYKCIKEHFRDVKKQSRSRGIKLVEKDNLLKTLRVMKPVLDTRRASAIEKVIKIYEILKS